MAHVVTVTESIYLDFEGPGGRLQIAVDAPAMSRELTFQKLPNWLGSSAKSPNDTLLKSRLRRFWAAGLISSVALHVMWLSGMRRQ